MAYPSKKSWNFILLISFCLLIFTMVFSITVGPADISLLESFRLFWAKLPVIGKIVDLNQFPASHQVIVHEVRMPRIIVAAFVGAALAAVGTCFQGLFKNPMADPYVIGISSGAALGAAVGIVTKASVILGAWAISITAFLGAVLSTWLVYNLAKVGGKVPIYTLLLAGIALSAFFNALMSLIMVLNAKELSQIVHWMLGSFSARDWSHVAVSAPVITTGIFILWFFAKDLNAMLFGDDTARHLGIDTEKTKKLLLVVSAITVSAAVAVSGTIGFVGLIIPHIVRLLIGPDHRILLPTASLSGATFMVLTDTFARTAAAPTEIPVGIITAFFGGPFFIYLLKRNKAGVI